MNECLPQSPPLAQGSPGQDNVQKHGHITCHPGPVPGGVPAAAAALQPLFNMRAQKDPYPQPYPSIPVSHIQSAPDLGKYWETYFHHSIRWKKWFPAYAQDGAKRTLRVLHSSQCHSVKTPACCGAEDLLFYEINLCNHLRALFVFSWDAQI